MIDEIKYVPKEINLEEDIRKEGMSWKKVTIGLGCAIAFGIGFGSVYGTMSDDGYLFAFYLGIWWTGAILMGIGWLMLCYYAVMDTPLWFFIVMSIPGGTIAYTISNWSEAKYAFVIHSIGFFFYIVAVVLGAVWLVSGGIEKLEGAPQMEEAVRFVSMMVLTLC
jgi:hypothetical protein